MARFQHRFDDLALDAHADAHWFAPSHQAASANQFSEQRAVARPIGHAGWATLLGTIAGALGGLAMLKAAEQVLAAQHSTLDLSALLGSSVARLNLLAVGGPREQGMALAIVVGALVGAPLGFLARRLVRVGPRLLFFWLLAPITWIFVQAVVMSRVAPHLTTTLPLVPLLVGALAYGTCIAIIPPVRARLQS
ncbi:MAG TPA: hypothetical protein VK524_29055 [Polyangiaceae bacterium]|nr:hypothetical protein [Polyangiaceae bacterium]